jgi:hypothetical protein
MKQIVASRFPSRKQKLAFSAMLAVALFTVTSRADAAVLVTNVANTGASFGDVFAAQSFTTPAGGPFDDIVFNFYFNNVATPEAPGTLFLLSQSFSGSPNELSTATPGYLDSAAGANGTYAFNLGTTLQASTQYFVYENGSVATFSYNNPSDYAGGAFLVAPLSGNTSYFSAFSPAQLSSDFTLAGNPVAAPEPTTIWLLGAGSIALGLLRRPTRSSSAGSPWRSQDGPSRIGRDL